MGTLETLIGSRALYSDHVLLLLRSIFSVDVRFFTRPSMEISTKRHYLLEFSIVTDVVKNYIKCILLNERLRDFSLVPITRT